MQNIIKICRQQFQHIKTTVFCLPVCLFVFRCCCCFSGGKNIKKTMLATSVSRIGKWIVNCKELVLVMTLRNMAGIICCYCTEILLKQLYTQQKHKHICLQTLPMSCLPLLGHINLIYDMLHLSLPNLIVCSLENCKKADSCV